MANDNVVALPGFLAPGNEPIAEVVALAEEALEKARSGKLQGIAIVMVERNPDTFENVYHSGGARHTLAAGALALAWKIGQRMATD